MQKSLNKFFIALKLGVSFIMLFGMMVSSISCGSKNKKPKEAIIKERQEILSYIQQRNPNDSFKFAYSSMYPKFDPNKPYKTGLKYNTRPRESYSLNSQLLNDENSEFGGDFVVEVRWDDEWETVNIVEDTYAQELLVYTFKHDLLKVLPNPKELSNVFIKEDLTRRLREKIKSYDDARAIIAKEKDYLTIESRFYVKVDDYDKFSDKAYQKAKLIEYIKAVSSINDCDNKVKVEFFWGDADAHKSEFQGIAAQWSSGDLDNVTDYASFVDAHIVEPR